MASHLGGAAAFSRAQSRRKRFRSGETQILRPRYVSLPERGGVARWTPRRLYRNGHRCSPQTDARLQRVASHGLGRVRSARRAICRSKAVSIPPVTTRENVAKFKSQLKRIGFSYDWQREINTTDPRYYKWTQWIFLQIYNSWFNPETKRAEPISTYRGADPDSVRLAYVAEVPVNWCPELGTVLANEEVVDGKSEVGGFPVVRRPMRQWMLRITAYAERLLDGLDELDWPEGIKLLQRNWIGRSEGAEIDFKIDKSDQKIRVFTTRPDTLYGADIPGARAGAFCLSISLLPRSNGRAVRDYRERTARKSDLERADLSKEKTGVFTGAYAINPANSEKIPIWIADYVLVGYGTGAIRWCARTRRARSWNSRRKFDLPIVVVVQPTGDEPAIGFTGEGIAVNSPIINGLTSAEAKRKITAWLEERGLGKACDQLQTARLAFLAAALLG